MPISVSFNLIEEPWIPCLLQSDGGGTRPTELGLRAILARAPELRAITGSSPIETIALHRLLLAVLHRALEGPEDETAWAARRSRGTFADPALDHYLDRWCPRFDLFDRGAPFYQTPDLPVEKAGSIAKLFLQQDNTPILFDHSRTDRPPVVTPGEAARALIACHAFDAPGIKTGDTGRDSATSAPLLQAAVCLVRGRTLFETLLFNWHRYSERAEEPFAFDAARDLPAWERAAARHPMARAPDGYVDLMTWQSRRILLVPEPVDGGTVVPRVVIMKGAQFPEGLELHARETMVAYRKVLQPTPGQRPWVPIGLSEDRAVWRDSHALFRSLAGQSARPRTLTWLADLVMAGHLARTEMFALDVFGLMGDRAKLLFWRHERLNLPLDLLEAADRLEVLQIALTIAERVSRLLGAGFVEVPGERGPRKVPAPFTKLAGELLGTTADARAVVQHLAPGRRYWSLLEPAFRRFVPSLTVQGVTSNGRSEVLAQWLEQVRGAARDSFSKAIAEFDVSARQQQAAALAADLFAWELRALLPESDQRATVPPDEVSA
jgi:CRISPR system Cascade subunit CasA